METTSPRRYAGDRHGRCSPVNAQVEAGCAAPADRGSAGPSGSVRRGRPGLDFTGAGRGRPRSGGRPCERVARALRAYLLGYDLDAATSQRAQPSSSGGSVDQPLGRRPGLLGREDALLDLFADVAALSRRVPDDPARTSTAQQHAGVPARLPAVPRRRPGRDCPTHFVRQLRTALARYGVAVAGAHAGARAGAAAHVPVRCSRVAGRGPVVIAILDRRLPGRDALAQHVDRRAAAPSSTGSSARTQGRHPAICDLARDVALPLLRRAAARAARATGRTRRSSGASTSCRGRPGGPDAPRELIDRVVVVSRSRMRGACSATGTATRTPRPGAGCSRLRTRRYYRIRELTGMRCDDVGGAPACLADYDRDGQARPPRHRLRAASPSCRAFATCARRHLRARSPTDRRSSSTSSPGGRAARRTPTRWPAAGRPARGSRLRARRCTGSTSR